MNNSIEPKQPLSVLTDKNPLFNEFYNELSELVTKHGCIHTHYNAHKVLQNEKYSGIEVMKTLGWLCSKGGYCDCEVLMNVID